MNPQSPMWAPVIAAGIVALGAVLGNLLALLGVWLVQAKTSKREREAKEREAKEKRANRWDDFRMKTLIDLQDTLHQMVLIPRRSHTTDPERTPPSAMNDMMNTRLQASVLCSRLRDEQLKKLVQRLAINSTGFLVEAARDHQTDMYSTFDEANDKIGELLSELRPEHP